MGGRGGGPSNAGASNLAPPTQPAVRASAAAAAAPQAGSSRMRDEDGFQIVNRHTWPRVDARKGASAVAGGGAVSAPTSWAEVARAATAAGGDQAGENCHHGVLEEEEDDGGFDPMLDDDDADEARDGDDCDPCAESPAAYEDSGGPGDDLDDADGGDGGAREASEEDLRQAWEDARESARVLESNPRSSPTLVTAARRERDRAEAAWRAAKQPQPLQKRLRWAQRAYDAAANKQRLHQDELDRFEEEYARRRKFLVERTQADRLRTSKKLSALEALLAQGGEQRHQLASEQAARAAATGIATELGPALAAVADMVAEGTPAWVELQAAMATLANVEDVLRRAVPVDQGTSEGMQPAHPALFDISGEPNALGTCGGRSGMDGDAHGGGGAAVDYRPTSTPTTGTTSTTSSAPSPPRAASTPAPRWVGPRPGSRKWGGGQWKKQDDDMPNDDAACVPAGGTLVSSSQAKVQAERLLAEQRTALEAAQAKEKLSVEEARLQAAEAARLQQLQLAQQQRAEAEAREAAETVRRAQRAVAEAEAAESARLEEERRQLVARALPEDLRRAQEMHAQQTAIINQQQQQLALQQQGLLQGQTEVQRSGERGVDADAERLMAMSDDELERWNAEAQQGNW